MTTQETQDTDRLSKLEGAYEQVNERFNDLRAEMNQRFNDLARGQEALGEEIRQVEANLRAEVKDEIRGVRTEIRTVLLLLGALWASMVGGFIALFLSM